MTMLAVDGKKMSHVYLSRYLDELAHGDKQILFQEQYINLYDNGRTKMRAGFQNAFRWWGCGSSKYQECLSALLEVEATCQVRLALGVWAKFECCKRYLQELTAPPRTPSPHRERRGRDTPEPDKY